MDDIKSQIRKRELRDTASVLSILVLGITLMCLAGTLGIRLSRQWIIPFASGGSVIDPDRGYKPGSDEQSFAPLSEDILTPFPWNAFLTPQPSSWNPTVVPPVVFLPVNTATTTSTPLATTTPQSTSLSTQTLFKSTVTPTTITPTNTRTPTPIKIP
jgi:hypothetical protein